MRVSEGLRLQVSFDGCSDTRSPDDGSGLLVLGPFGPWRTCHSGIMSKPPDPFENLQANLDQNLVNFLETDLALCFTFADIAAARIETGNREHGEQAIADAEKGYQTVSRFLADRHASHMNAEKKQELTAELQRLRKRLDSIPGS
jgi:hypothetical protein